MMVLKLFNILFLFFKYGGSRFEDVQKTPLLCRAIDEIECYGNRTFLADMQPCIK